MTQNKSYKKTHIGEHKLKPESLMMSYGYAPELSEGSVKPPVFLTSTFIFSSAEEGEQFFDEMSGRKPPKDGIGGGLIYSRFNHPNVEIIEDRLALLEGSEDAAFFSSGMGAISAVLMSYLRPGDVVLFNSPLYGGTETLIRGFLSQFNIQSQEFYDGLSEECLNEAAAAGKEKGRIAMIYVEAPTNPTNSMVDFSLLQKMADNLEKETGHRPVLVCDNTMLGPIFQKAVPQGVDLAVYSVTKYIGGHSDLVAGAVCGSTEKVKPVIATRSAMGLNLDPHTSWMIARSLETLNIRMKRAAETSVTVANWLADNPYIEAKILHADFMKNEQFKTVYKRQCTGPGSTFSFIVDASKENVFKMLNSLKLFKLAVSLGGSESLVCHPASTTHSGVKKELREKAGVTDGLVRLSIGLEDADDLIADLNQAFKTAFSASSKEALKKAG